MSIAFAKTVIVLSVRLSSPRSILPTCCIDIPAILPSISCDKPLDRLRSRNLIPNDRMATSSLTFITTSKIKLIAIFY